MIYRYIYIRERCIILPSSSWRESRVKCLLGLEHEKHGNQDSGFGAYKKCSTYLS